MVEWVRRAHPERQKNMAQDIEQLKRQIAHLPPVARKRAERELGIEEPAAEHRVFVYGTLLSGEINARRAGGARRQPATAKGTLYDTGFGVPAYTREGDTEIAGELLVVDDGAFASMDRLEGCPRLYRREEIEVCTSGGARRAWVYIMNSLPASAKVIPGGSWRAR